MKSLRPLPLLVVWLFAGPGLAAEPLTQELKPLLEGHCFDCHGADTQQAGLRLDTLSADLRDAAAARAWEKVFDKLSTGEMPPKNLQGQSLVPMLNDPTVTGRGWALTQVSRGGGLGRATVTLDVGSSGGRFFGYSLRTPRWRYTEWDEGRKGRELYDHDADPRELTNLADNPEHKDTLAQLSTQLRTAAKATFPESGKTPELRPALWAPNLTEP